MPGGVNEITRLARVVKLGAVVWMGDRELPVTEQGVKVLGVPSGTPEYVQELAKKGREQEILFQRIPWVNDPQAAWLILLMCGSCYFLVEGSRLRAHCRVCGPSRPHQPRDTVRFRCFPGSLGGPTFSSRTLIWGC